MSVDSWVRCIQPRARARIRLFCFPYAGGGASLFRTWSTTLPLDIEVCPVQLPGRENRIRSPAFDQMPQLVDALARAVQPHLDIPFAFFGHSMGALVSFELARQLRKEKNPAPVRMFVSGHRGPQLPDPRPPIHHLPEDRLIGELIRLNGTRAEVLRNTELRQLMIPLLRADFSICETYFYSEDEPLDCPIEAFGGLEDVEVSQEEIGAWREQTRGSFTKCMFPGDHFFVHSSRMLIMEAIAQSLKPMPPKRTDEIFHASG